MARVSLGFAIPGLKDFRNDLRAIDGALPKALQKTNKAFAERLVGPVRAEYSRHYPRQASSRSRRRGYRKNTASRIRALATQTSASIAIGGARYEHMLGQEFGSERYRQFAPYTGPSPSGRGSRGRFLWPVIREEVPTLVEDYGSALMGVVAAAYPDRR